MAFQTKPVLACGALAALAAVLFTISGCGGDPPSPSPTPSPPRPSPTPSPSVSCSPDEHPSNRCTFTCSDGSSYEVKHVIGGTTCCSAWQVPDVTALKCNGADPSTLTKSDACQIVNGCADCTYMQGVMPGFKALCGSGPSPSPPSPPSGSCSPDEQPSNQCTFTCSDGSSYGVKHVISGTTCCSAWQVPDVTALPCKGAAPSTLTKSDACGIVNGCADCTYMQDSITSLKPLCNSEDAEAAASAAKLAPAELLKARLVQVEPEMENEWNNEFSELLKARIDTVEPKMEHEWNNEFSELLKARLVKVEPKMEKEATQQAMQVV